MDKIVDSIKYAYKILRYRHDVVSGEFVNIGIVFYDAEKRFLCARVTDNYERIAHFFGSVASPMLLRATKQIEHVLNDIGQQMTTHSQTRSVKSITDITSSVLPPNDNSLFFSTVFNGWHLDHQKAFDETFERLVGRYTNEVPKQKTESVFKQPYTEVAVI